MSDTAIDTAVNCLPDRGELEGVVARIAAEASDYLARLDRLPVISPRADAAIDALPARLPERGAGAAAALSELVAAARDGAAATSGPRCFHFVIGGVTPAALGADWLATLLDQPAYTWVSSPIGVRLELAALDWLKDLFGLPASLTGILTTGATMANFVGLATARQWCAERLGVDPAEHGLAATPPIPVLTSGYVHASAVKCISLLGLGRSSIRRLTRDRIGRLDLDALARALRELDGRPAIVIANAGEVNAGDFDPIDEMADLAKQHGAWLHVDGAFGLFARVSPRTAALARGVERADSVISDGHKWLNVPYDCGFAFVRDRQAMARAFAYSADYLPSEDDPRPTLGAIGPESSRRARALAVWSTLRAYGRSGYREMVERHLDLARHLARRVDDSARFHRLAEVPLNIVCFRYDPGDRSEAELDRLNEALGAAIHADGRVLAGTTRYDGKVALRPAIVNWRTERGDIDTFFDVVEELAAAL